MQHLELVKPETLESATELVNAMKFPDDFDFTMEIKNPVLQNYYSVLQAVALAESQSSWNPQTDDTMKPCLDPSAVPAIESFRQTANLLSPSELELEAGSKRKRAPAKEKAPAKVKAPAVFDGVQGSEEHYNTMTIPQLKELCKENNLKVGGNKKDLIDRLLSM
jgi:hypothetical protein